MRTALLAAAAILAAGAIGAAQRPVFRAETTIVSIGAAVKQGNTPVRNLTAADFALVDDGVAQRIEAVTLDSVPLDVTLFMDTSHSTAQSQARMQHDIAQMAAILGPTDQFRLLTIGLAVQVSIPWRPGGAVTVPETPALPGVSLIYDALAVALAHTPAPERRHLIVAMTDGEDCGSIVDGPQILEMSGRTESVLHWVRVAGQGGMVPFGAPAWCTPMDGLETDYVGQAARRSGGDVHGAGLLGLGDPAVPVFRKLVGDFRYSYVLRYTPTNAAVRGWHDVQVTVPGHREYTIQAKAGYYAAP